MRFLDASNIPCDIADNDIIRITSQPFENASAKKRSEMKTSEISFVCLCGDDVVLTSQLERLTHP